MNSAFLAQEARASSLPIFSLLSCNISENYFEGREASLVLPRSKRHKKPEGQEAVITHFLSKEAQWARTGSSHNALTVRGGTIGQKDRKQS